MKSNYTPMNPFDSYVRGRIVGKKEGVKDTLELVGLYLKEKKVMTEEEINKMKHILTEEIKRAGYEKKS